jgi:hypothetical protein
MKERGEAWCCVWVEKMVKGGKRKRKREKKFWEKSEENNMKVFVLN